MKTDKQNIFHGQLVKKDDGTISTVSSSSAKYEDFIKNLNPGQTIEVFMEANEANGTLTQLAKVHACIRQLAKDTGQLPADLKIDIKKSCSLCFITEYHEEKVLYCKSFGDCSKDELGLILQEIIKLGDFVGINFR